jgi:hypothetical protein
LRKNVLEPFGTEDMITLYGGFRGHASKIDGLSGTSGLEVKR